MNTDRAIIGRQLGRPPRGLLAIEVRCPWGYPAVIRVTPLIESLESKEPESLTDSLRVHRVGRVGEPEKPLKRLSDSTGSQTLKTIEREPFPTLFWLTCPIVREQLSHLEEQGVIGQLEEQIERDRELLERYAQDHRRYAHERFSLLSDEEQRFLAERGWLEVVRDRGIAGVADFRSVKCLHAQYAYHLARGSVIGRWLQERFQFSWCPANEIRCRRFDLRFCQ